MAKPPYCTTALAETSAVRAIFSQSALGVKYLKLGAVRFCGRDLLA